VLLPVSQYLLYSLAVEVGGQHQQERPVDVLVFKQIRRCNSQRRPEMTSQHQQPG